MRKAACRSLGPVQYNYDIFSFNKTKNSILTGKHKSKGW